MSIIYEALKKTERQTGKESESPRENKAKNKSAVKYHFFLIPAAVILFGITAYLVLKDNVPRFVPGVSSDAREHNLFPRGMQPARQRYVLQGVIYDQNNPVALINGKRVRIGESIDGGVLISLNDAGARLEVSGDIVNIHFDR